MTPPSRNWNFVEVFQSPGSGVRCDRCNARIRWVFLLEQGDDVTIAGRECVKALTATCDPDIALRALKGKWRTRRNYWWRKLGPLVWTIGRGKHDPKIWWVGVSLTAASGRRFLTPTFASPEAAKAAIARWASDTGAVVETATAIGRGQL